MFPLRQIATIADSQTKIIARVYSKWCYQPVPKTHLFFWGSKKKNISKNIRKIGKKLEKIFLPHTPSHIAFSILEPPALDFALF